MIKRAAIAIGAVVFLVASSVGASYAYWSASAGVTTTVKTADPGISNCTNPVKLVNGSFEVPVVPSSTTWMQYESPSNSSTTSTADVPGWSAVTVNTSGNPTTTATPIELWRGQISPVPDGAQNLEVNATVRSSVRQTVTAKPGQKLSWSFQHRGRDGNENLTVYINNVAQATVSAGTSAWIEHTGTYTVPGTGSAAVPLTFELRSAATSNPSQGNLVDKVVFGTGPCLSAAATLQNPIGGGTTFAIGRPATVTIPVVNLGNGTAAAAEVSIPIPSGVTVDPGAVKVNGSTTGVHASTTGGVLTVRFGQGATAATGGTVTSDAQYTITFDVIGAAIGAVTFAPVLSFVDGGFPSWLLSNPTNVLTGAVIAAPVDTTPPDAPSGVKAVRSVESSAIGVTVSWNAVTVDPGGSGVAGYHIYVNNESAPRGGLVTTGTSQFVSGLDVNTPYWFRVTTVDNAGNEAPVPAAATGAGAATYVTGTSNVRINYPGASGRCVGASTPDFWGGIFGESPAVEIRNSCDSGAPSRVQWTFVQAAADNSVQISLAGVGSWKNSTSGIDLTSNSDSWWMDVQWDSASNAPYLRIMYDRPSGTDYCASVSGTANGNDLQMSACSAASTQRFSLATW